MKAIGEDNTERILIPNWEDRLIYLAKFIIKNYYKKPTYVIVTTTIAFESKRM